MTAIADSYEFTVDQGATINTLITWLDQDGEPIDLTTFTARMQVRPDYDSDSILLDLTTENGMITLGGLSGTITLNVPATDMEAIAYGQYVYDLEMVNGSEVTRLLMGTFNIRPEVTK